jgi:opacity protein-like surface antigen
MAKAKTMQPPDLRLVRQRSTIACALLLLLLALSAVTSPAQSAPSGYQSRSSLWLGAGYSNFAASFPHGSDQRISGYGVVIDYHWMPLLDVEGEGRWLSYGGFQGSTESSYLAGPKYRFHRFHQLQPYAKFLVGEGRIHYPYKIGDAGYFALAPGGGVTYALSPRWAVRADYEYQFWLNSPGFANEPDHPLAPNGVQIGIQYRIRIF